MSLDFNIIETGVNIEDYCDNYRVSRHCFRWNESNICLVRAYCYPRKNVVVISQVQGEVINNEEQIKTIIQKIQLKPKKTILITNIKNKFYKRIVRLNPQQLNDEEEISLHMVEELIESKLEPVETWLELDVDQYQKNELHRQKEIKKLLQLYLKPDLDFFTSIFEQREYELEQIAYKFSRYQKPNIPMRGALFYYPEIKDENQHKKTRFLTQEYLKESYKYYELSALSYVNKYDVKNEVVICVQISDEQVVCGIFPKIDFLWEKKLNNTAHLANS
ncbi:MAG: hypothetical protein QNJ60_12245 [Xenococcaceae cyanobacterium MO_188.B19]|nr:hypothetical protein [Xenococcaceae cyanobacterium MO_188.B19]